MSEASSDPTLSSAGTKQQAAAGFVETLSLAQVVSLLLILFLLLKAYAVADFSLTTTGALITSAPIEVVLGTVSSYAYIFLPLLTVLLSVWAWRQFRSDTKASWHIPVAVLFVVLTGLLSPAPYLFLALAGALLTVGLLSALAAAVRTTWASTLRKRWLGCYVCAVAGGFFLVTMQRPWVPAEMLQLKTPAVVSQRGPQFDATPVVHLLASGDWVTALNADTRYLMHVLPSDVLARTVCHHPDQLGGQRPVLYWLINKEYGSPNTSCATLERRMRRQAATLPTPP